MWSLPCAARSTKKRASRSTSWPCAARLAGRASARTAKTGSASSSASIAGTARRMAATPRARWSGCRSARCASATSGRATSSGLTWSSTARRAPSTASCRTTRARWFPGRTPCCRCACTVGGQGRATAGHRETIFKLPRSAVLLAATGPISAWRGSTHRLALDRNVATGGCLDGPPCCSGLLCVRAMELPVRGEEASVADTTRALADEAVAVGNRVPVPAAHGRRFGDTVRQTLDYARRARLPAYAGNLAYHTLFACIPGLFTLFWLLEAVGGGHAVQSALGLLGTALPHRAAQAIQAQLGGAGSAQARGAITG